MTLKITKSQKDFLISVGQRLGQADIMVWTLPWLMILVMVGTVAQKSIGLYAAQNLFFSSFISVWHGIPFPAGYSVLTIMMVNMVCKLTFCTHWTRPKLGINIAHLSIIVLLGGGLITALDMEDGYIPLSVGEEKSVIRDYHARALTFTDDDGNTQSIAFDDIDDGQTLSINGVDIIILQKCTHVGIRPRQDIGNNDGIGAASMASLYCDKPLRDNERNMPGITYHVANAPEGENGTYIVFEGRKTADMINGLTVRLDKTMRPLPFSIRLNAFRRDVYPGAMMARDFESRVTILDGDVTWPAVIAMNEPLRYGGYTFYQASTAMDDQGEPISVLSVVKNNGWTFPYISGLLMAFGLGYHAIYRTKKAQKS